MTQSPSPVAKADATDATSSRLEQYAQQNHDQNAMSLLSLRRLAFRSGALTFQPQQTESTSGPTWLRMNVLEQYATHRQQQHQDAFDSRCEGAQSRCNSLNVSPRQTQRTILNILEEASKLLDQDDNCHDQRLFSTTKD